MCSTEPTGLQRLQQTQPRVGELTPSWRLALSFAWILVFLAYMGVWKASQEIGIATWWLGPRSDPQPVIVRLVPFIVAALFIALASSPRRRLPLANLIGVVVLAGIAVPDFSRSTGLAMVEIAIAGAVAIVAIASSSGQYRAATPNAGG